MMAQARRDDAISPALWRALDALGVVPAPRPVAPREPCPPPWTPRFAGDQPPF